jgi:tetratricopeptide (TPR) repeat protein
MTAIDELTLRKLLAEVYYAASKEEGSDMLVTAEVLEFIRKELLHASPLSIWSRLSFNRAKYDKPFLTPLLVKLKRDYIELLYQSLSAEITKAYQSDTETGWNLWFQCYVESLVQWNGEVHDRLCRESFTHPVNKQPFLERLKNLNRWILESRWIECYDIYQEIMEPDAVSAENKVLIEVLLGQIELYRFPNYADSIKHFENAKSVLPNSGRVLRAFAEYYFKLGENDKGRSYIFNAMSLDLPEIENYQLMGDSYRDEGNISVAEQWYNDALNFNFLDPSSYSNFFGLYNDDGYFKETYQDNDPEKKDRLKIDQLIEKISLLEPDSPYTNSLYNAYRSAGNAFFINGEVDQSEKYYMQAIEMHPDWITAYNDLGYVLASSKKIAEAERIFEKAKMIDEDCFDLNWNLAWFSEEKGELDEARDYYIKSLSKKRGWSESIYRVIEDLYVKYDRYEDLLKFHKTLVEKEPTAANRRKLAGTYETLKKYDAAETQYSAITQLDPQDAFAWNGLGNMCYYKRNFAAAIENYKNAIKYDPSTATYLRNLGLAYRQLGDSEKSIEAYTASLEIKPGDAEALNAIGIAYYMLKQQNLAREWYQKAIQAAGTDQKEILCIYWTNTGLTFQEEGNFEEAVTAFLQGLQFNPDSAVTHYYLGQVYEKVGKLSEAKSAFEKALSINDLNFDFYLSLGLLKLKLEDAKGAFETIKNGFLKDPTNPEALKTMAEILRSLVEKDPGELSYMKSLGEVQEKLSNFTEALETYKKALSIVPEDEYFNNRAGICCYRLSKSIDAINYYKKAITATPNAAVYYENVGLAYEQIGDLKEAENAYLKTLEMEPQNSNYEYTFGIFYHMQGNHAEAIKHYQRAITLGNRDEKLFDNLGLAYETSRQWDLALETYQQAAARYPDNKLFNDKVREL